MKSIFNDTTLEAARVQFKIFCQMGNEGRAEMTFQLCEELRAILESGIRSRNPEYDDDEVRLELFHLTLGEELFNKVSSLRNHKLK